MADLNIDQLSNYLQNTQEDKIYMLYDGRRFHLEQINMDDYRITECIKKPERSSYIATTASGNNLSILLRWKNGNGIAFPAFQISLQKEKRCLDLKKTQI